tara:strand:- start:7 stop:396 length:390 start_codon:yes stop_codon:yes gene_type:complete
MSKNIFFKFVSEPKNDVMKSIVGLACTAQAINDGHNVSVFFAAAGTRLLDPNYLDELEKELGAEVPMVAKFMEVISSNATLYCSFASVKAVLGHSEGDGALIVSDDKIQWSGPPGVISLATASEIQITY